MQDKSTKLLGMQIEDNQSWKEHFSGKGGLIASLNNRLFSIRRVANHLPRDKLTQLSHALWMSKLRYGLQLCMNVRSHETELLNTNMKATQIAQNKLLRLLNNSTLKDRVNTEQLLKNTGLLSVNQLAASIKLMEVWKSEHIKDYPVQLEPNNTTGNSSGRNMRPTTSRMWNQDARTAAEKESFSRNAAKIWNTALTELKIISTKSAAKKAIKEFCKSLPI